LFIICIQSSRKSIVGPAIGGAVAGIAAIAITVFAVIYLLNQRRKRPQPVVDIEPLSQQVQEVNATQQVQEVTATQQVQEVTAPRPNSVAQKVLENSIQQEIRRHSELLHSAMQEMYL
jgi:hypothetical protein